MMAEPDTSDARYNYIYRGIVNIITSDQRLSIYTHGTALRHHHHLH